MTDIVERLRTHDGGEMSQKAAALMNGAADAIERLRVQKLGSDEIVGKQVLEIERLRADNARLRRELAMLSAASSSAASLLQGREQAFDLLVARPQLLNLIGRLIDKRGFLRHHLSGRWSEGCRSRTTISIINVLFARLLPSRPNRVAEFQELPSSPRIAPRAE